MTARMGSWCIADFMMAIPKKDQDAMAALYEPPESRALALLQSYVDERARRWAVTSERATGTEKKLAQVRMYEAIEIGLYIAEKIKEAGK